MAAKKASGGRRSYSPSASKSVESALRREKRGTLRRGPHGHGGPVTDPKQAIAIALNEARKQGAKVPPPPGAAAKKSAAKKSAAKKSTAKKSSAAKKSTTKRAAAKKSTAKKSAAKKSTARKSTGKRSATKTSAAGR